MTTNVRVPALSASKSASLAAATRRRRILLTSTALVGSALLASNAAAQALPDLANAGGAAVSTSGGPPATRSMTIDLQDSSRILDFNSYNVGSGNAVNYTTTTAGTTDLVAVNRVLSGGGASLIDGAINADAGISVWLINQDGITYNGRATFGGGSLMLSTLDFSSTVDGAFRTAFAVAGAAEATSFNFAGPGTGAIAINTGGANFAINGSIVAVSPTITTNGALTASNGSVVLVAGTDVTFTAGLGNPLSFTVNAGTPIGGGVTVGDDLTGQSVVLAGGLQNNLTATLLNVNAGANLTATAANGAVVLATATTAFGANTATITNGANAQPSIRNDGNLAATGANGDVVINSAHDITGSGGGTAQRNLTLTAARDINVTGNYTATTGNLLGTAGRDATFAGLDAGNDVSVTTGRDATFAGIVDAGGRVGLVASGDATVTGNMTAVGEVDLAVLGDTDITGDIDAGADFSLTRTVNLTQSGNVTAGGNAAYGIGNDATVTGAIEATAGDLSFNAGNNATLAAMTAGLDVNLQVSGNTTVTGTVDAGQDYIVDTVNYTQSGSVSADRDVDLSIGNDALVTGSIAAFGGNMTATVGQDATFLSLLAFNTVDVEAGRNATFNGLLFTGGDVLLTAGTAPGATQGTLTVNGFVDSGNDFIAEGLIVRLGAAGQTRTQTADGLVTIHATTGDIEGRGNLTLESGGAVGQNIALTADTGAVNFDRLTTSVDAGAGDVIVTSAPTITLGNVTAANLFTAGDTRLFATGAIATGDLTIANALAITSTTGSIRTGDVTVTGAGSTLKIYAAGATSDITTDALRTNRGNIFVSAERDVVTGLASTALNDPAGPVAGSIGMQAGRNLSTGALTAGADVTLRAPGFINTTSATAGDDVSLIATGNITLPNATVLGTGVDGTAVQFGAPGVDDSIGIAVIEDLTLVGNQIRLSSSTGMVTSTGLIDNAGNGNVVIGGGSDVTLNLVTATGAPTSLINIFSATTTDANSLTANGFVAVDSIVDTLIGGATSNNSFINLRAGRDVTLGTGDAATTIDISAGRDASVGIGDAGTAINVNAARDIASATRLATTNGNIFLSAGNAIAVNRVDAGGTGSVGALAGGAVQATTLIAARDIAVHGGTTGAVTPTDVTIGSATAGDDIDAVAFNGNLSLATGTANAAVGAGGTAVAFVGAPGTLAAMNTGGIEDAQAAQSIIRLRSEAGDVTSATQLTTLDGDVIVNAFRDVSLNGVTASGALAGGSIAVRAGRGVTSATNLVSNNEDVSIGATGNIALGTVTAADDIDLLAGGRITGTSLTLTGGPDRVRFADVTTGTAGATGGVTFTTPDDAELALANVVRIRAADVGNGAAGPVGLIVNDVLNSADFDAQALAGDIRLGDIDSTGNISVVADNGSVTGLPIPYAAVTGLGIAGADTVNINVTGTAIFGSISADTVRTVINPNTLRVGQIIANTVDFTAVNTIDLGSVNATGTIDLLTTGGAAAGGAFVEIIGPDTRLVEGFDFANLSTTGANSQIFVRADNGVAQLGTLQGTGIGAGGYNQVDVRALALTLDLVRADGGSLLLEATEGLLSLDYGRAREHAVLIKRDTSGTSLGTPDTTDLLQVTGLHVEPDLTSGLTGGWDVDIRSETSANVQRATASGLLPVNPADKNLFISAARDITVGGDLLADFGSIGLYAGSTNVVGSVTANRLRAGQDITISATRDIGVNSADAGDDIDFASTFGNIRLDRGDAGQNLSPEATRVAFTGTPGQASTISVIAGEDAALTGQTIRLRSELGSIASVTSLTAGSVGDVIVNAALGASLTDVTANGGSIGVLAGQAVSARNLLSGADIRVRAGTSATITSATADDDIDVETLGNHLTITNATSTGTNENTTAVTFGAAGALNAVGFNGVEDADFATTSSIRLTSGGGGLRDIISSGTLLTQGRGDVLVNSAGAATLTDVRAVDGSIGITSGFDTSAGNLIASRDIAVQGGGGIDVGIADAGDDIDMVALSNTLELTDGTARGTTIASGTSTQVGGDGRMHVVAGEDASLANLSTIRLGARSGDLRSTGTLTTLAAGDILLAASSDGFLNVVDARNGSIGVLVGRDITATGPTSAFTATRDLRVEAGRDAFLRDVTVGDDIDIVAGNRLSVLRGTSLGTAGSGGTGIVFGPLGSPTAVTVVAGSEDAQLAGRSTIRLRSSGGDIAGDFGTPTVTGATLNAAAGDVIVNTSQSGNLISATATTGSVGVIAGGTVDAGSLVAGIDVGVRGTGNVTINTASAGDDIDIASVAGNLALTSGSSTGTATGRAVDFGAAGSAGGITFGAVEAPDFAATSSIRLRSEQQFVNSTGTLQTAAGNVLVNAATDATLNIVGASGSVGILAGRDASANLITAGSDVAVRMGRDAALIRVNAGDDIDIVAGRELALFEGTTSNAGGTTRVAFTGLAGAADALGVVAGEDAQLTRSTIRLVALQGNVAGALGASPVGSTLTAADGEILVNALHNVTIADATATRGSIGLLAGDTLTATTLVAGTDIAVRGGTVGAPVTGVTIGSATAGDDLDVLALNGLLSITDGTSTGLGAAGTSVDFATPAGINAVGIVATEDADLASNATIRLRSQNGNVTSTGTLRTQGTGNVLVNASGNVGLNAVTASGGSIALLAGTTATATNLTASRDIAVKGGTGVTVTRANAGDDIDALAVTGNLVVTDATSTGTAGTGGNGAVFSATLAPGAAGAVNVAAGEEADFTGSSTIRLRAAAGDVTSTGTLATTGAGNILVNAAQNATLATADAQAGSVAVLAGANTTAASLTAAQDVAVKGGTGVTITLARAGDDIDALAVTGNLALTDGTSTGTGAGGNGAVFSTTLAPGAAGAVSVAAGEDADFTGSSTIRLRAAAGNVVSTGTLRTQGAGNVLVNAAQNASLGTADALQGSIGLLAGNDVTAGTLTASLDVAVSAGRDALITTATAGDDIDVLAGTNLTLTTGTSNGTGSGGSVSFGTAGADHAVTAGGADASPFAASTIRLRATNGSITGTPASGVTGTTLTATKGDILATAKQNVTIRKASALDASAARAITIEASDVIINGLVETSATTGTVTLRNNGANATVIGDSAITTSPTFGVANAELGLLHGKSVVVDSGAKAMELAKIDLLADTGASDVRFLGSGDIEITNVVTVTGTAARTLQIGGVLGALSDNAGGETLAKTIIARIDRVSRPRILAGSSAVELRGDKILFGTTAMVAEFLTYDPTQIAAQVSNPGSKLYGTTDPGASLVADAFLVAKQVTVGYKNFALFQNTQPSGYKGVEINSGVGTVPTQTELALRLISTGDAGGNSFSMFGVVNGFIGTSAALLGNQAVQIANPGGDPNQVRITRASSRLNGCIIGAPDKGCLATDIPQPQFDLYDERVVALFDADDDSTISVSPLIGRGNDGLIVNVADAPVNIDTIECRPEDPNCPAQEGE